MEKIKGFLQERGKGFYVTAVAALLSLLVAIVYISGFSGSVYFYWFAFLMPIAAAVVFLVMSPFPAAGKLAACLTGLIDFVMLLMFITYFVPYLSGIFYSGITAQALASLDFAFVFTLIGMIGCITLANIGMYLPHKKEEK